VKDWVYKKNPHSLIENASNVASDNPALLIFLHLRKTVLRLEVLLIISSGTRSDSMTLSWVV
jgi:hypothetical protein